MAQTQLQPPAQKEIVKFVTAFRADYMGEFLIR